MNHFFILLKIPNILILFLMLMTPSISGCVWNGLETQNLTGQDYLEVEFQGPLTVTYNKIHSDGNVVEFSQTYNPPAQIGLGLWNQTTYRQDFRNMEGFANATVVTVGNVPGFDDRWELASGYDADYRMAGGRDIYQEANSVYFDHARIVNWDWISNATPVSLDPRFRMWFIGNFSKARVIRNGSPGPWYSPTSTWFDSTDHRNHTIYSEKGAPMWIYIKIVEPG